MGRGNLSPKRKGEKGRESETTDPLTTENRFLTSSFWGPKEESGSIIEKGRDRESTGGTFYPN